MTILRSGNSWVSCLSGVLTRGQVSSQRTPSSFTLSSAREIISNAPGTSRRRVTARATSISGEMMMSMGMLSRENKFAQTGSR